MEKVIILMMIILPTLFIPFLIFNILKELLVKINYKYLKYIYIISAFLWMLAFSYLSYIIYKDSSLNSIWCIISLITLTAPLGILAFIILQIIGFIFNINSNELFFSILFTNLFILGYYQWFIWFPKYLKKPYRMRR